MQGYHIPVMLEECITHLDIKPKGVYVDCTLGEAGHSLEILKKLDTDGKLYSIDRDQEAIDYVKETYTKELETGNWKLVKSNFTDIDKLGINADGILMDLGVSSRQIDQKERGFSYRYESADLDMRMDKELGVTALDLINVLSEAQLTKIFWRYGEERFAKRIANIIKRSNITNVGDLTSLIYKVVPATTRREDSHHPARRVFQALRIAVNDELNSVEEGIDNAFKTLNTNGRLCIISFHSLEDRIVKTKFKELEKEEVGKILEYIEPTELEIERNPRSRSAKLRVLEKIK